MAFNKKAVGQIKSMGDAWKAIPKTKAQAAQNFVGRALTEIPFLNIRGTGVAFETFDEDATRYNKAVVAASEVLLRNATGAATNPDEKIEYIGLMPKPGEDQASIQDKIDRLAARILDDASAAVLEFESREEWDSAEKIRNYISQNLYSDLNQIAKDFTGKGLDPKDFITVLGDTLNQKQLNQANTEARDSAKEFIRERLRDKGIVTGKPFAIWFKSE